MTWLNAFLLACAVLNIGLTVYHATILRRARRYQADTARLHAEAERLLGELRRQHAPGVAVASNGHRPALEHEAEP